jgi:hypothetical protein
MTLLAPADPIAEQVALNLVASLAAISALTPDPADATKAYYWYTPDRVLGVDEFVIENLRPKDQDNNPLDVIYQVVQGDGTPGQRTSGQIDVDVDFWIVAAKLWPADARNPWPASGAASSFVPRRTYQNRLLKDIRRRLEGYEMGPGVNPLGVAFNLRTAEESRDFDITGMGQSLWAVTELRITVSYRQRKDTP